MSASTIISVNMPLPVSIGTFTGSTIISLIKRCGATQFNLCVSVNKEISTPLHLPQLRFTLIFRSFVNVSTVEHAWAEYVICTCESYRERRKTWEPFTARTVVINEKFVGKDESKKKEHTNIRTKSQSDHPVHTCSSLFQSVKRAYISTNILRGNSCLVGALSWIFLSILNERSVSSCPSLLMHSPASKDTPSISSDKSSIFRTSTRSAERKDKQLVKGLVGMTKGKKNFLPFQIQKCLHRPLQNQTLGFDGWIFVLVHGH